MTLTQNKFSSAEAFWQATMPSLWLDQLDRENQGNRFLDETGRDNVRRSLNGSDFERTSDSIFIELNRTSCLNQNAVWQEISINNIFNDTPMHSSIFMSRLVQKKIRPFNAEARSEIERKFSSGHLFAYEIAASQEPLEASLIFSCHRELSDMGIKLMDARSETNIWYVPSLSLLSALYVHLFNENALVPIAVAGEISPADLHNLHIEGRRAVGLTLTESIDEDLKYYPSRFAWHDLYHGLLGMIFGDRSIFAIGRHFSAAMDECEAEARKLASNFRPSIHGNWHSQKRNLHDLLVCRDTNLAFGPTHDKFLFYTLSEFLNAGEFHNLTGNSDAFWNLFIQNFSQRLLADEALKHDPEAKTLLAMMNKLTPKPAEIFDEQSFARIWNNLKRTISSI